MNRSILIELGNKRTITLYYNYDNFYGNCAYGIVHSLSLMEARDGQNLGPPKKKDLDETFWKKSTEMFLDDIIDKMHLFEHSAILASDVIEYDDWDEYPWVRLLDYIKKFEMEEGTSVVNANTDNLVQVFGATLESLELVELNV